MTWGWDSHWPGAGKGTYQMLEQALKWWWDRHWPDAETGAELVMGQVRY